MNLEEIITSAVISRLGDAQLNKEALLKEVDTQITNASKAILAKTEGYVEERIKNLDDHTIDRIATLKEDINKLDIRMSSKPEVQALPQQITITVRDSDKILSEVSVGLQHAMFPRLVKYITLNIPVYIVGPTGSGKTIGVMNAGKALDTPVYRIVVSRETQKHELFGYMDATGKYIPGIAYEPFVNGGILFIDEIDNGNANANVALKMLVDTDQCYFPWGMMNKHKDFRLVVNANTVGNGANLQYVGRNQQDKALLNIFAFLTWDYDLEFERQLAISEYTSWGGKDTEKAQDLVVTFQQSRKAINELGLNHVISPRNLFNCARMLAQNVASKEAFYALLIRELDQAAWQKVKAKIESYASQNSSNVI